MVECPTLTPSTSVIASWGPGEIPYPYSQLAGAHAASAAQGEDAVHLLSRELEIEDVEVLP